MRAEEIEVEGRLDELDRVSRFLDEAMKPIGLDERASNSVQLAVEELFVNMIKYNEKPVAFIRIGLVAEKNRLTVTIRAAGIQPFDIGQVKPVDTGLPLEQRPVGGLGIHLVNTVMDTVEYRHADNVTTLTLTKQLEKDHVQHRHG